MALTKGIIQLSPASIVDYLTQIDPRTLLEGPLLGRSLFPLDNDSEIPGFKFEYLRGVNSNTVMAPVTARGVEAPIIARKPLTQVVGEIPPIQVKFQKDEEDIKKLGEAFETKAQSSMTLLVKEFYNDIDRAVRAIFARHEWLACQSISVGTISLTLLNNNRQVIQEIDWGVPVGHKITLAGSDVWTDLDDSNPLEVIQAAIDTFVDTNGFEPGRAVSSRKIISYLGQNVNVRQAFFGKDKAGATLSLTQINELFNNLGFPQLAAYDKRADIFNEDGTFTSTRYLEEDRFVMLPPENVQIGRTFYSKAAEEYLRAEDKIQNVFGVIVTIDEYDDPPTIFTKGKGNLFPVLQNPNAILIIKAY
jgi:hypothetical protein